MLGSKEDMILYSPIVHFRTLIILQTETIGKLTYMKLYIKIGSVRNAIQLDAMIQLNNRMSDLVFFMLSKMKIIRRNKVFRDRSTSLVLV